MTVDTRRNVPCSLDNRSDLSLKVKKIKCQKQCRGGCVEVGESLRRQCDLVWREEEGGRREEGGGRREEGGGRREEGRGRREEGGGGKMN